MPFRHRKIRSPGGPRAVRILEADRDTVINQIINDVAELPDRNSPEDWPEAMLVTADELRTILLNNFSPND